MSSPDAPRPQGLGLRNGFVLAAVVVGVLCHGSNCAADNVTLEDIRFQIGRMSYRAPRLEFVGANLDRQQLSALFAPDGAQPLHERLAALSAQAVNVPELTAEWPSADGRQAMSVRDLRLQNVVAGKAARVTASEVTSEGAFVALSHHRLARSDGSQFRPGGACLHRRA